MAGGLPARVLRGRPALRPPRPARPEGRLDRASARMIHDLPLERRTLHGHFSRELDPVLTVDAGDSVRFQALNSGWRWEADREFLDERDESQLDAGHALCGPIEVRGARAGQTLAVRIEEVRPGSWGVTFADGTLFHWQIDADAGTATNDRGATVSLAPFLGVIGMPPDEPGIRP